MSLYWFPLGVLAVWRVTHLLNAEDGPWGLVVRMRRWAGTGIFGSLMDCFQCLSLWVAIPFTFLLGGGWKECLLLWLALSAGAILAERLTSRGPAAVPPAHYEEDSGGEDGMLR